MTVYLSNGVSPSELGDAPMWRWHFGVPFPALVVDIGPRAWHGNLSVLGLIVNAVCAGGVACAGVLVASWLLSTKRPDGMIESTAPPYRPFRPTLFSLTDGTEPVTDTEQPAA